MIGHLTLFAAALVATATAALGFPPSTASDAGRRQAQPRTQDVSFSGSRTTAPQCLRGREQVCAPL
jgi:hypothetical protein